MAVVQVDVTSDTQHARHVHVSLPNHTDTGQGQRSLDKVKAPECVTLSLRKERFRTREKTYMSDMGGSDVFSDDTCAARVNSDSVRVSVKSEDMASWVS